MISSATVAAMLRNASYQAYCRRCEAAGLTPGTIEQWLGFLPELRAWPSLTPEQRGD